MENARDIATDTAAGNGKSAPGGHVFLFLCHFVSPEIIEAFKDLQHCTAHMGPAVILLHNESGKTPFALQTLPVFSFTLGSLATLGYATIGPSLVPGHVHFPLLRFFLDQPGYGHYWLIENDLRFSGNWRSFFDACSGISSDYLAGHIRPYCDAPKWPWWFLEHPQKNIALFDRLASFNPFCRLSNSALAHLHRELSGGWRGHQEVVLPTLLHQHGYSIVDIGGRGRFTPSDMTDRFYLGPPDPAGKLNRGTLRYRPPFRRAGAIPDKLYHPVKPLGQLIRWYLSAQAVQFGCSALIEGLSQKAVRTTYKRRNK